MATVSAPRTPWNPAQVQQHIHHPLQSLSGYIRVYVILEGLALTLLFVSVCFWLVLAADLALFQGPSLANDAITSLDIRFLEVYPVDWIKGLDQSFPVLAFWMRSGLLALFVLAVLALVGYLIVRRLFKEFSDRSLALVLERRFPKELGDRLITAVEMAQPGLAQKYGYSQEMVDHTIRSAADRVQQVPVLGVFNWRRLIGQWLLALGASLGIWLGVLLGLGAVTLVEWIVVEFQFNAAENAPDRSERRELNPGANWASHLASFHRAGAIVVKRDVLLLNKVYWPTRSYVEIVRFQDTPAHPSVMKVGREDDRPDIRAQAFEWVVYDPEVPDTIRPLRFHDLDRWVDADLLNIRLPEDWGHWVMDVNDLDPSVPSQLIPEDWQDKTSGYVRAQLRKNTAVRDSLARAGAMTAVRDWLNWKTWTVDRIKLQLDRTKVRVPMRNDYDRAYQNCEKLVGPGGKLEELAADPATNWDVRRLRLPEMASFSYRGDQTKGRTAYARVGENRYVVHLTDFKETVQFWMRGDDFVTPVRTIDLVAAPGVVALTLDRQEPAYLHWRLQGGDRAQQFLRGKKQSFLGEKLTLSGTVKINVPMGTDLLLTGETDRKYKDGVTLHAPDLGGQDAPKGAVPEVEVKLGRDQQTFRIQLLDVRTPFDFEIRFTDLDNIKGRQHVIVEPTEDKAPTEVVTFELNEVLRKPRGLTGPDAQAGLKNAYLITPDAVLPFKGTMKDDYGLTNVEWQYEYQVVRVELTKGKATPGSEKKPSPAEEPTADVTQTVLIVGGFRFTPVGPVQPLAGIVYWTALDDLLKAPVVRGTKPIDEFQRIMQSLAKQEGSVAEFRANPQWLQGNFPKDDLPRGFQPQGFLPKEFDLRPGLPSDNFNVGAFLKELKPQGTTTKGPQLHYRLQIWLKATDNNVQAEQPGQTLSKAPVTFLVVSEKELLSQIVLAEEDQRDKLVIVIDKLGKAEASLADQVNKLDSAAQLQVLRYRLEGYAGTDEKNLGVVPAMHGGAGETQKVLSEFERILRQMEINKLDSKRQDEVKKILTALVEVTDPTKGYFAQADRAVSTLQEGVRKDLDTLESEQDAGKIQKLMKERLPVHLARTQDVQQKILDLMNGLARARDAIGGEIQWGNLLTSALEMERSQRRQAELWHILYQKKVVDEAKVLQD